MTDDNTAGRNNHARAIIEHTTAHRAAVQDELFTISEVADILRAPVATLRYWRHLGNGPHNFRIGRTVRYWDNDVTTWLQQQSSASDQPRPGPGGEARRRPRWGAGTRNVWNDTSGESGHPRSLRTGLGKEVPTTFGGTWPDQRKDQRTPWGVRAWGNEVGDVPPP